MSVLIILVSVRRDALFEHLTKLICSHLGTMDVH